MNEHTEKRDADGKIEVNLDTGEIIPEEEKKSFKTPEATKTGSLKKVSRAASPGDTGPG